MPREGEMGEPPLPGDEREVVARWLVRQGQTALAERVRAGEHRKPYIALEERNAAIVEAALAGEPYVEIARRYGLSASRVPPIVNRGVRQAWAAGRRDASIMRWYGLYEYVDERPSVK